MLVEFRVGDYRSFHEEQVLSLVASNDNAHPGHVIPGGQFNLLKAAAVYGPNASGKSNLLRAIAFMKSFVCDSATKMNVGDEISVTPFRLTRDTRSQPSSFEVTLIVDKIRYEYGFKVTRTRVCDEWLFAYPEGRQRRLFERRLDPTTKQTHWRFPRGRKKHTDLLRESTRDNGLVLSRGAELNMVQLIPVFQWFRNRVAVLDLSLSPVSVILERIADRLRGDADFRFRAIQLLRDADLGIRDIRVDKQEAQRYSSTSTSGSSAPSAGSGAGTAFLFTPLGLEMVHTIAPKALAPGICSVHSVPGTDREESFDFVESESKGTQRFLALLDPWLDALRCGALLAVDEVDCSMHPALTRKLMQLFQDPEQNKRGAQLVVATHDTSLMDLSLFRRDQLWLVEKDAGQASRLSSLYDFKDKPRKGEALEKRYLGGRYGGVPVFGPSLEGLGVD